MMNSEAIGVFSDTIRYLEKKIGRGATHLHLREELVLPKAKPPILSKNISKVESQGRVPIVTARTTPPLASSGRVEAFETLKKKVLACTVCPHLVKSRKQVVFGVGNMASELMFVGEAPGADEDEQGEPFVGRAGQLLTKMIQAMNFQRADVYIGNVLKCRPDVDTPAGNRKPTPEEMETCIPYLKEQIKIIQPKVLVALGDTAVKGLVPGLKDGITKLRGKWLEFESIPLMPTFHPAYLLRNQSLSLKRACWEDMLQVLERLNQPISTKQRNYFLSGVSNQ